MVQFSGPTIDFAAHFPHVAGRFSGFTRFDWVLDNLNTHYHLELCEAVAALSDLPFEPKKLRTSRERRAFLSDPSHEHVFHFTPTHGSRINQVELWFSVLARQFLARGNFSGPADFAARLERYLGEYNRWCVGRRSSRRGDRSKRGGRGSGRTARCGNG